MRKYCSTEQTLFVTLDIGKNVHWFGAYAGFDLKEVVIPFKVRSDRTGFNQATTVLDALLACGAYEQVALFIEADNTIRGLLSRLMRWTRLV